jgi:hypothetical protein
VLPPPLAEAGAERVNRVESKPANSVENQRLQRDPLEGGLVDPQPGIDQERDADESAPIDLSSADFSRTQNNNHAQQTTDQNIPAITGNKRLDGSDTGSRSEPGTVDDDRQLPKQLPAPADASSHQRAGGRVNNVTTEGETNEPNRDNATVTDLDKTADTPLEPATTRTDQSRAENPTSQKTTSNRQAQVFKAAVETASKTDAAQVATKREANNVVDLAASVAATSPNNNTPEPTDGQIDSGNYKKGHVKLHALNITIENPRGSTRSGTAPDGERWTNTMDSHYGYIKRTDGADGDQVDVYLGENLDSAKVFVVNQVDPQTKAFDEHKVMMGFKTAAAAKRAYLKEYEKGWKGFGSMVPLSVDQFKEQIKTNDFKRALTREQQTQTQTSQKDENQTSGAQKSSILTTRKNTYINQQIKLAGFKKGSPGYGRALERVKERYHRDLERAEHALPFDKFKALSDNAGISESLLRQAYDKVREDLGITDSLKTSGEKTSKSEKTKETSKSEKTKETAKTTPSGRYDVADIRLLVNDLSVNGAVAILPDGSRTPSLNPEWYKDGEFLPLRVDGKEQLTRSPSVKTVKQAVFDLEDGKSLSIAQLRIIEELENVIDEQRDRTLDDAMNHPVKTVGDVIPFSKTNKPGQSTVQELHSKLPRRLRKLQTAGKLKIVQSLSEIEKGRFSKQGAVEGVYLADSDTVYIVADNVSSSELESVVNHELLHRFLAQNPRLKDQILGKQRELNETFLETSEIPGQDRYQALYKTANRRVQEAGVNPNDQVEELAAYLVSEYSRKPQSMPARLRKAVADLIAFIRGLGIKAGLLNVNNLTPADLTALARHGANSDGVKIIGRSEPLFSQRPQQPGWKGKPGFGNISAEAMDALNKSGPPTKRDAKTRALDAFSQHKVLWRNKFRQRVVDQYDSFKSILNDPRSWRLANMLGSAGGAIEAALRMGQPRYDKSGLIDNDISKKSLAQIMEPLGEEVDRFMMWIAANRSERIKKASVKAQAQAKALEKEIAALKRDRQDRIHGNSTVEGRTDINYLDKLVKQKKAEVESLKAQAEVTERLWSDKDIAALKTLANNDKIDPGRLVKYEAVRKDLEEMHGAFINIGVQTGLISKEDAKIWKDQGFYVPFYRVNEDTGEAQGSLSVSGLVRQQAFKKLKGADMPLDDLLMNTVSNWHHIVTASLKNQAARSALDQAVEMKKAVEIKKSQQGKNSLFVRENGKTKWYDIEDSQEGALIHESLVGMNFNGLNTPSMRAMRAFKRALTTGVTASPEFKVANLIRDSLQAIAVANMSKNVFGNINQGFKATKKGTQSEATLLSTGAVFGESGYLYGGDHGALRNVIARGFERASILDTETQWKKAWNRYQEGGARLENVNRAAGFNKTFAEDGTDLLDAAFEARDHLAFDRTGSAVSIRAMSQIVPFLNARLQGLDKLQRAMRDPVQAVQFYTVVGAYAVASSLLYLGMKDDEDYKNAEQWERDTYHLFKFPGDDKHMYRIPRPFEVGAIANMVERILEQVVDDKVHGELFAERLKHMFMETFAMNPVPQMFKPTIELWANKSAFTGRDIESASMKNLSVTERKKAWTSQTAIGLSKAMDTILWDDVVLSPVQIDHAIRGYLGWAGATALAGVDQIARPLAGAPSTPENMIQDYPVIGRFVRENPRNSRFLTTFFETQKELNTQFADIKNYRDQQEFEKLRKATQAFKGDESLRKLVNRRARRLSEINKRIRLITNDRVMGPAMKRRKINDLNRQRIDLARKTVEFVESGRR